MPTNHGPSERPRAWPGGLVVVVVALAVCPGVLFPASAPAGSGPVIELANPRPGQLLAADFALARPGEVTVEAVGLVGRHGDRYSVTAWILDHDTRRPVWRLAGRERRCLADSRYHRRAREAVRLDRGSYTLFLHANERFVTGRPFQDLAHLLRDLAALIDPEDPGDDLPAYLEKCRARLELPPDAGKVLPPRAAAERADRPDALVAHTRAGDGVLFSQPFRIVRPTSVRLRALGEAYHHGEDLADYAWIEEAADGDLVWMMAMDNTRHAGGAEKNRLFDGEIRLAGGEFVVHHLTDDSHSWEHWNAPPPHDPRGWGVVLTPGKGYLSGDLEPLRPGEITLDPRVLVKISKVGNDEHRQQEFRLLRPAVLSVTALGEGDRDEMWDTAWIVDAERRRTVWRMAGRQTRHAGGARKNRVFAGKVKLGPGRYVAHYETDGSHAFGAWNAPPPREPHRWGVLVLRQD